MLLEIAEPGERLVAELTSVRRSLGHPNREGQFGVRHVRGGVRGSTRAGGRRRLIFWRLGAPRRSRIGAESVCNEENNKLVMYYRFCSGCPEKCTASKASLCRVAWNIYINRTR